MDRRRFVQHSLGAGLLLAGAGRAAAAGVRGRRSFMRDVEQRVGRLAGLKTAAEAGDRDD